MNLSDLKVGDEVIVVQGFEQSRSVQEVEKIGKLHITIGGKKFRLNGYAPGTGYHRPMVKIPKPGELRSVRCGIIRKKIIWSITPAALARLSNAQLYRIDEIMKESPEIACAPSTPEAPQSGTGGSPERRNEEVAR